MLLLELSRFLRLSRTCSLFPGLSIPRKFQNKIPGLSRFCRTCTNPDRKLKSLLLNVCLQIWQPLMVGTSFPTNMPALKTKPGGLKI